MASVVQSGAITPAVLGTEENLGTEITTVGSYVLRVDTANLVNGEEVQFRAVTKARTADTAREEYAATYKHAQGQPNKVSIPVVASSSVQFKIKQTGGTLRAYPYAIVRLDG